MNQDSDRDSDFDFSGSEFKSDDSLSHVQSTTASTSRDNAGNNNLAGATNNMPELFKQQ